MADITPLDVIVEQTKEIAGLQAELDKLPEIKGLLEIAKCPQCDGSGGLYDAHGRPCQCQWCYERKQALKGK